MNEIKDIKEEAEKSIFWQMSNAVEIAKWLWAKEYSELSVALFYDYNYDDKGKIEATEILVNDSVDWTLQKEICTMLFLKNTITCKNSEGEVQWVYTYKELENQR